MASLMKRGRIYYACYYVGGKERRVTLKTDSHQIAKAKLARLEVKLSEGVDNPLPSRTPLADVLQAYVEHIRTVKTPKSAQTDVYYLREMFGPICEGLRITARKVTEATRKKKLAGGAKQDRRRRAVVIEKTYFEDITTRDVSEFVAGHVARRGLKPKTANRYREIIVRLFNWAMTQRGIRMPGDRNPAAAVERYKEKAPQIRYLTLPQIDEQLHVLRFNPRLQTIVAIYIYAGLRREELLWLTPEDVDLKRRGGSGGMIRVRAKTIDGESWQPKTGVNRVVPISQTLRGYLDKYEPPTDSTWYLPSPQGKRWDGDNMASDLRAANKAAGLQWTCLDFRHTFGSQLAQKGVSLYKISQLMGNSPEICRRHYAALTPEAMSADVEFTVESARYDSTHSFSSG